MTKFVNIKSLFRDHTSVSVSLAKFQSRPNVKLTTCTWVAEGKIPPKIQKRFSSAIFLPRKKGLNRWVWVQLIVRKLRQCIMYVLWRQPGVSGPSWRIVHVDWLFIPIFPPIAGVALLRTLKICNNDGIGGILLPHSSSHTGAPSLPFWRFFLCLLLMHGTLQARLWWSSGPWRCEGVSL